MSQLGSRALARVGRWGAPPENLWLSALLLLVFPWDDALIDAIHAGLPTAPAVAAYGIWILFDCCLVAVVLASGGRRLLRTAAVYAALTAFLDGLTAAVYFWAEPYGVSAAISAPVLDTAFVVLIARVMWLRLQQPERRGDQDTTQLFQFVVPMIVSIAVAYAASWAALLACVGRSDPCGPYGPAVNASFFEQAAQIIAALLIALAIEARLLSAHRNRSAEERGLINVTVVGFAVGVGAALTAVAAQPKTLPVAFGLTVQALTLGFATILMLPRLSVEDPPGDRVSGRGARLSVASEAVARVASVWTHPEGGAAMTVSDAEQTAITEVVQAYIDGSRSGDADQLRRAFHPDARMYGSIAGQRFDLPIEEFFALASGQPADVDGTYEARIVSIEQVGDAATAAIEEIGFWGTLSFTDFFALSRFDGEWKIVNKTFAHTGGEPPAH